MPVPEEKARSLASEQESITRLPIFQSLQKGLLLRQKLFKAFDEKSQELLIVLVEVSFYKLMQSTNWTCAYCTGQKRSIDITHSQ